MFAPGRVSQVIFVAAAFLILLISGCATEWKETGAFDRTRQTQLTVESTPAASVYVDNRLVGRTPLTTHLDYKERVIKKNREVSYWQSQPAITGLLTIGSLGLYAPIAAIPVDTETSLQPNGTFTDNSFEVRVRESGYHDWTTTVVTNGEESVSVMARLQKQRR